MSEELVVQHCSPTLAGIKTGNLFGYSCETEEELKGAVRKLNRMLGPKGIRVIPLEYVGKRALIYIYRPSRLREDLKDALAAKILKHCGYACKSPEHCIVRLSGRLRECQDFPHEIGLFLGYPPEDVEGFMIHKGNQCKCSGCWKVYGNETNAKKCFAKYKKCTEVYYAQWSNGKSIERLTVTV